MPAERLSMRQIREVLRLWFASGLPQRAIARSLGLGQGSGQRAISAGPAPPASRWPLPEDLDDARLEALLFPPPAGDRRPISARCPIGPGCIASCAVPT